MIKYSNNDWRSMGDKYIIEQIGLFIKKHRLNKNMTQETVAKKAGLSRSTVSLLENGESATFATFIQILRVLDLLYIMEIFRVEKDISPIALAKLERKERQRSSGKEKETPKTDW